MATELESKSKAVMDRIGVQGNWPLSAQDADVLIRRSVEWSRCGMEEAKITLLVRRMVEDFSSLAPEVYRSTVAPWIEAHFPWALGKCDVIGYWPGRAWADLHHRVSEENDKARN